ncbi:hypothetical protein BD779DRAFT_296555 [Infundibulicybe gibba]|nr:hypothetical protein BD779DRAFT_296555 [Infundibulicybe gibba]
MLYLDGFGTRFLHSSPTPPMAITLVAVNLASVCVESLLYGIFCILFILSLHFITKATPRYPYPKQCRLLNCHVSRALDLVHGAGIPGFHPSWWPRPADFLAMPLSSRPFLERASFWGPCYW